MILTEVRDYIRSRGQVALRDLALQFDMEEQAMRGVLEHWERKGRIKRLPKGTSCNGCSGCSPEDIELFKWLD
ncbi:MAG: FeoC-like transcriptional regulator [Gammaproteobacteria bacterium]|nr:FeoC-like transcriptional regulator [Gammaproteobacteria bacterium]